MNKNVACGLIGFAIGAAAGVAASAFYFKKKYEAIADEEIENVREVYRRSSVPKQTVEPEADISEDTEESTEPEADQEMVRQYYNYTNLYTNKGFEGIRKIDNGDPILIDELEFGAYPEYTEFELTYYADGKLVDDMDELVDDVEEIIGDALDHFDDEMIIYVQNDRTQSYYEIIKDTRRYSDVMEDRYGDGAD